MKIAFDPAKNEINLAKHGLSMALADYFDFSTATIGTDSRRAYGETRYIAQGYIGDRLHIMIFVRRDETVRVVSLRKANKREERKYHAQA